MTPRLFLVFVLVASTYTSVAQNIKHTIFFNKNSSATNRVEQQVLDSFVKQIDTIAVDSITIYGYSDYLGRMDYNKSLSTKRAERVRTFLKQYDQYSQFISLLEGQTQVDGKGEIFSAKVTPNGIPEHRKVEITVYPTPQRYSIDNTRKVRYFKAEEGMKFNEIYVLEKVYFVGNKPELLESSYPQLEDFYRQIKQIKTKFRLVIKGHICCLDDDADDDDKLFSQTLSTARALRIQDYLVKKGIPEEYIEFEGYSFDEPLKFPEITVEDRQINRRVEAIIYK